MAAEKAQQEAAAEAAKKVAKERQMLQELCARLPYLAPKPSLPPPRPSVKCERCGATKSEGADGWKESKRNTSHTLLLSLFLF